MKTDNERHKRHEKHEFIKNKELFPRIKEVVELCIEEQGLSM